MRIERNVFDKEFYDKIIAKVIVEDNKIQLIDSQNHILYEATLDHWALSQLLFNS